MASIVSRTRAGVTASIVSGPLQSLGTTTIAMPLGGQRRYSDLAIETALTLRLIDHLPLRPAEGSYALFGMMRLDLSAPTIRRFPPHACLWFMWQA